MKKLQLSIKTLLVTAVLFISCSENEPDIEEICTSENYTVNFDRYVDETVRTPTNIVVTFIKNIVYVLIVYIIVINAT